MFTSLSPLDSKEAENYRRLKKKLYKLTGEGARKRGPRALYEKYCEGGEGGVQARFQSRSLGL